MTPKVLILSLFVILTATAQSAPDHFSPSFLPCWKHAQLVTDVFDRATAQIVCVQIETGIQDHRLNTNYMALMEQYKSYPPIQAKLRNQERQWILKRTRTCFALENNNRGPIAHQITVLLARRCTMEMTMDQADYLSPAAQ